MYQWQLPEWEKKGVEIHLSVDIGDGVWEKETHPPRKSRCSHDFVHRHPN